MDGLDIQNRIEHYPCVRVRFYNHFLLIIFLLMKITHLIDVISVSILAMQSQLN